MAPDIDSHIVLASKSPRRRRLLGWLGLPFEMTSVDTPESLDTPLAADPSALAASLAEEKAAAALEHEFDRDMLVLTFDTIVVLDGTVLGKPRDDEDARRMLSALSGRTHQVVTGVGLSYSGTGTTQTFAVTTDVRMQVLSDQRIGEWMAEGEHLGCAGAYNIEAQIADVGPYDCYQNVAGLPLCHVYAALRVLKQGCPDCTPRSPVDTCDEALGRHCTLGPRITGAV